VRGRLEVQVGLLAGSAGEAAVREAVSAGRSYVEAGAKVVLVDPARLQVLARAQSAVAGGGPVSASARSCGRIGAARAVEDRGDPRVASPGFRPPEAWRALTAALRDQLEARSRPCSRVPGLGHAPVPAPRGGMALAPPKARPGGVLADEMGLGKTLQALALVCAATARGGTALVVCPASLVENWNREAARFAPHLRVFVNRGGERLAGPAGAGEWDLVITSYGTLARDAGAFLGATFACVVGDEAQHIKNARSQNAQVLRSLRCTGRFLLTGTPVENSLDDLRSLFEFALPGYLERVPRRPGRGAGVV